MAAMAARGPPPLLSVFLSIMRFSSPDGVPPSAEIGSGAARRRYLAEPFEGAMNWRHGGVDGGLGAAEGRAAQGPVDGQEPAAWFYYYRRDKQALMH